MKRTEVDSKGRLNLGTKFSKREYIQTEQEDGTIILTPAVPAKEAWLWSNKKAMESVQRGLEQSIKGEESYDPREKED